jgi:hypothetical protein
VKQGADLPVRRISYNVRKLSEECNPRWNELIKLNCESIIFFTIAFNGLASLPDDVFSWLVQNLQNYVQSRAFPPHWILRDQIRKVVSNTPRKENTKPFLAKYTAEEMKWCETPAVSTTEVACINSLSKGAGGEIMSYKTSCGDEAEIACQRQTSTFGREYRSHASYSYKKAFSS